ncbi:MAG: DUF1735 domain-containing protein [Alistipes sp.]|nr:DUF1735 domain-containing protein [Alistipes sp.]
MKRILNKVLLSVAAVAILITGCKDERNNNMVDDTILFRNSGTDAFVTLSMLAETYNVVVLKSGKGTVEATAIVFASEDALSRYNLENGTDYEMLPASYYTLSQTELKFGKSDADGQVVTITWDSNQVGTLGDDKAYVIPLEVTVKNNVIEASESNNVIFIYLTRSYVQMETTVTTEVRPGALYGINLYDGTVVIDNPIPNLDITVNYAIDYDLVTAYNQANGTNYLVPPDKYNVSLAAGSSVLSAGESETYFSVNFDTSSLFSGNELVTQEIDYDQYLVPVRITSTSNVAVGILEEIMYIPVSLFGEVKGPWAVIEGEDICYAVDPNDGAAWTLVYTTDRLFDGDIETEWISLWETQNEFPMVFVADMGKSCVFTKFYIGDHSTMQGQYRNYEIYTAVEYNGASTQWNLVADGLRDYDWTDGGKLYEYPVKNMIPGRYLKFVILNAQYANSGDYIYERGKLTEVFGEGF